MKKTKAEVIEILKSKKVHPPVSHYEEAVRKSDGVLDGQNKMKQVTIDYLDDLADAIMEPEGETERLIALSDDFRELIEEQPPPSEGVDIESLLHQFVNRMLKDWALKFSHPTEAYVKQALDMVIKEEERLKQERYDEGDWVVYNWLDDDGNDNWKIGRIVKIKNRLMYYNDDNTERCGYMPISKGVIKIASGLKTDKP